MHIKPQEVVYTLNVVHASVSCSGEVIYKLLLVGVDQGEDPVHAEVVLFPFSPVKPNIIQFRRGIYVGNTNPQTK